MFTRRRIAVAHEEGAEPTNIRRLMVFQMGEHSQPQNGHSGDVFELLFSQFYHFLRLVAIGGKLRRSKIHRLFLVLTFRTFIETSPPPTSPPPPLPSPLEMNLNGGSGQSSLLSSVAAAGEIKRRRQLIY